MHIGDNYVAVSYGNITGVSKKGFKVISNICSQGGAIRYYSEEVRTIDKKGKSTTALDHEKEVMYYDLSKNKTYKKGKTLFNTYQIKGKKSTKNKYKKAMKKYSFKKIKWTALTKKSITSAVK